MSPFPPDAGGPRDLPPGFAERLEGELEDAALVTRLTGAEGPRPLPPDLDARLEASLLGRWTVLPYRVRRQIGRAFTGARPVSALVATAAVVLMVVGLAALPGVGGDTDVTFRPGAGFAAPEEPGADPSGPHADRSPAPGSRALPSEPAGGSGAGAPDPAVPETSPPAVRKPVAPGAGPEPPFAFSEFGHEGFSAVGSIGAPGTDPPPPPPPGPPVRLGVAGGGTDVEAGFRAYVELLNEQGGARGRTFELVPTSGDPADDVAAVVNLGPEPLPETGWVEGPLFEAPGAPERMLDGRVFSFSSVLERQAHVAALSAVPEDAPPGTRAVIYRAESGVYGDRVPAALAEALDRRGVVVVTATWDPDAPLLLPADVAFVSLAGNDAAQLLAAARGGEYRPTLGIWGVGSLFDEALLPGLDPSVRLASPYGPGGDAEMEALRERSGRPVNAATIHGWVTAKALAVAVWRNDPGSPEAMTRALEGLEGWVNGFMPAYRVRPGTRSRTPEAVVMRAVHDRFEMEGEFVHDRL